MAFQVSVQDSSQWSADDYSSQGRSCSVPSSEDLYNVEQGPEQVVETPVAVRSGRLVASCSSTETHAWSDSQVPARSSDCAA